MPHKQDRSPPLNSSRRCSPQSRLISHMPSMLKRWKHTGAPPAPWWCSAGWPSPQAAGACPEEEEERQGGKATNHEVSGSGHMIVHCVKARQIFAPRGSGDAVSRFVTWAVASLSMPVRCLTKEMEGRVTSGGSCETLQHPSGQTHFAGGLECDANAALFPLGCKAMLGKCANLRHGHDKVKVKG